MGHIRCAHHKFYCSTHPTNRTVPPQPTRHVRHPLPPLWLVFRCNRVVRREAGGAYKVRPLFFLVFHYLLIPPTEPSPLSQTGVFGTHYPFGLRFDATGWFEGKQAGHIRCARYFFSIFTTLLTLPTELFPLGQTGVFGTPSACVLT